MKWVFMSLNSHYYNIGVDLIIDDLMTIRMIHNMWSLVTDLILFFELFKLFFKLFRGYSRDDCVAGLTGTLIQNLPPI